MFSGIIQDLGEIKSLKKEDKNLRITLHTKLEKKELWTGNSLAVNGTCLTIESDKTSDVELVAVPETLDKTNLGALKEGDKVNLELPLTLNTALAGHLVSGHVDGQCEVINPAPSLKIKLQSEFLKFCPKKGSICLNGVSLTIADIKNNEIDLALIPETMKATNLGELKPGQKLNFEIDLIARYLNKLNS